MTRFGIDFGTTNSLAATVVGERVLSLTDRATGRPHPSVIWYRGSDVVVGRDARQHLDTDEGSAPLGFVRSPKMSLRQEGPIYVDGRPIDAADAVAEVLRYVKQDAAVPRARGAGFDLSQAVMTIPVDFGGPERRRLRSAARKAGIGVTQFVHEPVAALYGYLRTQPEYRKALARLEGRSVLVFDWGGGTLDLTVCRIKGGAIMQVASLGDNEVGGDEFDARLRNLVRNKHASAFNIEDVSGLEQPGMAAKLLNQCELAKIELSKAEAKEEIVFIRDYLRGSGPERNLNVAVNRQELEDVSEGIVARGLARIDEILSEVRLTYQDVELCLATGGMVNMPAIRAGLRERFVGRVPTLDNGDRIIAEGAAWIAHDGLRLTLSKPIELLVADTSGSGTYHTLVEAGFALPLENVTVPIANSRLFCVDPREGVATIEIAKPARVGEALPSDPRVTLCVMNVAVDPHEHPLVERLQCLLQVDHDYVVTATFRATGLGSETKAEFHALDFGLALPAHGMPEPGEPKRRKNRPPSSGPTSFEFGATARSNVTQRSNVVLAREGAREHDGLWRFVPGDILYTWRPEFFDIRSDQITPRQLKEQGFYIPCARCKRTISNIRAEGPIETCRGRPCGRGLGNVAAPIVVPTPSVQPPITPSKRDLKPFSLNLRRPADRS